MSDIAAAAEAIRAGKLGELRRLLRANPNLAVERIGPRTLLHVAADWPGHFPNAAAAVAELIAHGADVNARFTGRHTETPLHWAASSDDVAVLDALLDHGADIEAPGAVIGGGTPLADAVGFGQWQAARRLVERGARTTLAQAAALGLTGRVEESFASHVPPANEITRAFWYACHGGQRATAEYLLRQGADQNWVGYNGKTPLDAAERNGSSELVAWLRALGAKPGKEG